MPANIGGLRVVQQATALNLPFADVGHQPQVDWKPRVQQVYGRMKKILAMGFSAFGRATAVAAYGLQLVTWHMEHDAVSR